MKKAKAVALTLGYDRLPATHTKSHKEGSGSAAHTKSHEGGGLAAHTKSHEEGSGCCTHHWTYGPGRK